MRDERVRGAGLTFMMRDGESIQERYFEYILCARHCQRAGGSKMKNIHQRTKIAKQRPTQTTSSDGTVLHG